MHIFSLAFVVLLILPVLGAGQGSLQQPQLTKAEKKTVKNFEKAAKRYVRLRNKEAKRLPRISDEATPEQIAAYKANLLKNVQTARGGAKQGDVFSTDSAMLIRTLIKREFKGYERKEIRESVLEADTRGVPLKVNAAYPESKELVEMSPALLLTLPQLPKELRYRYIGRSLAILDRDSGLIVDFMRDALP